MSDDWETPKWLLEIAFPDGRFYDPCPIGARQKGKDGLKETWPTDIPIFINPPWSAILPWVERAVTHIGPVAMLLPVDSTTTWYSYSRFFKVCLIDVRLKFIAWKDPNQRNLHGEPAFKIVQAPPRKQANGSFACMWWFKPAEGVREVSPNFAPKERLKMVGPVPTLANELDVAWNNISPTDRDAQDRFFKPISETDEHLFLAIDEFDAYCTRFGYKSAYLYHIMNFDRNFGKGVCAIARGTSDVSTNAIASCDLVLWFRTSEKNLLKYIRETLKGFPGGQGEAERTVSELPKYVALLYMPLSENRFPGFLKVVHGELLMYPLPSTKNPTDADSAGTPIVESSSDGPTGPTSAGSTTRSGPANKRG